MTNPFDIQDAAFIRRDQLLRQADAWRMLREARRQDAGGPRRAWANAIGRLFRIRWLSDASARRSPVAGVRSQAQR